MRQARCDKIVLFNGSTRGRRLFLSLSDIREDSILFDNANLLILFKQDGINLKHVYNDHVNTYFMRFSANFVTTVGDKV